LPLFSSFFLRRYQNSSATSKSFGRMAWTVVLLAVSLVLLVACTQASVTAALAAPSPLAA